jgi:hypothetical protein
MYDHSSKQGETGQAAQAEEQEQHKKTFTAVWKRIKSDLNGFSCVYGEMFKKKL